VAALPPYIVACYPENYAFLLARCIRRNAQHGIVGMWVIVDFVSRESIQLVAPAF